MTIAPICGTDITEQEARSLVEQVRSDIETLQVTIRALYGGRAWLALGYESWADLCRAELPTIHDTADHTDIRSGLYVRLRIDGLSNRAIASATGTSEATVRRRLAAATASNDAVELPATITGIDGRERAAVAHQRQSAEDIRDWMGTVPPGESVAAVQTPNETNQQSDGSTYVREFVGLVENDCSTALEQLTDLLDIESLTLVLSRYSDDSLKVSDRSEAIAGLRNGQERINAAFNEMIARLEAA
jgi:hypothetical protein